MRLPAILRALAIGIAVLGAVDPAITSERPIAQVVAVVDATPAGDSERPTPAAAVRARLHSQYVIEDAVSSDAAALIVVGDRLPAGARAFSGPAFVVQVDTTGPAVRLLRAAAPPVSRLASRVPVDVRARVSGAEGRTLRITLRTGDIVVDRVERKIASADETVDAALSASPIATGVTTVHVSADIADTPARAEADTATEITDTPWSILVFDRRPSWLSTFVRRAIERDARFDVKSRTVTSTAAASDRGQPPTTLADAPALMRFDAILVGAPDALTSQDVSGLEAFTRQRGGTVVLLADQPIAGPASRLVDVSQWTLSTALEPVTATTAGGAPAMQAAEFVSPDRLPSGAHVLATATVAGASRVVVFERPVGAGRIIASGAADAWRYRGVPDASPFDRYWQGTIAAAASSAPPAVAVELATRVMAPGDATAVRVTVRDAALGVLTAGPATAGLSIVDGGGTSRPVRLWPDGAPGRFRADVDAPAQAGSYRIVATAGAETGAAELVVSTDARSVEIDDVNLLRAWVSSRGGAIVASSHLADLDRALAATLHPEHRPERWWPMRSGWWMAPFAALLSGEWWLRRRRDLR